MSRSWEVSSLFIIQRNRHGTRIHAGSNDRKNLPRLVLLSIAISTLVSGLISSPSTLLNGTGFRKLLFFLFIFTHKRARSILHRIGSTVIHYFHWYFRSCGVTSLRVLRVGVWCREPRTTRIKWRNSRTSDLVRNDR